MATSTEIYEAVVRIDNKLDKVAEEVACMRGKWKGLTFMVKLLWPTVGTIIAALVISWAI